MSTVRTFPAPPSSVEYEEFWSAANEGKLMIPRCKDTNQFFWYPRKISPFTLSENIEWIRASGKGTIYTFSIHHSQKSQFSWDLPARAHNHGLALIFSKAYG